MVFDGEINFMCSDYFWGSTTKVHISRLSLHSANERRRYKVAPYLIGWAQT